MIGAVALLVILVLLLVPDDPGGSPARVEAGELERTLRRDIGDTAGARVETVDCPGETLESRDGAVVECALELADGQAATAEVTFSDAAGNFTYEIPAGQFRQEGSDG